MTQPPVTEVFDQPPAPDDAPAGAAQFPSRAEDAGAELDWAAPPGPPAPRRRRFDGLVPKTLTGRLVTGVVSLVIVIVAVIGTSTYFALSYFLSQRLDQQLDSISNVSSLNGLSNTVDTTSSGLHSPQDVWLAALTTSGTYLGGGLRGGSLKPMKLSATDAQALVSKLNRPRWVQTTDGYHLRVQSFAVSFGFENGQFKVPGIAVIGLTTQETDATLGRLVGLEAAIGAAAVALAAALTAWGVRVGLRPLHRVTRTAQEVTAELGPDGAGLERRVPDADPDTEVGQVASSVNTLLGAVQNEFAARVRSEDRMRQFLADASHELRTPLTSIRGYAELSRLKGQSSNDADDPMRRIEVEGTRMSRLVEDLLVLARGDDRSNQARREPVEVDALLQDALSSAESGHPDRHFDLVSSHGAVVLGDRDQLLRLLLNLLNNASTHTRPDGPIRLEGIQAYSVHGGSVQLRVIDSGPGLPPEDAAHVFERFWRADKARSRAKGGSGLGMAIVAQIAEAHGGSVSFDSSVEAGTAVTVTLPLRQN
ncbi:HAMP domain-containing sensor histidine kinase [soil metagenome]